MGSVYLEVDALGASLNPRGWAWKGGQAVEYKSSDSNYRTWRPTVTETPERGLYVSAKLDHIRGLGKDDHCVLEVTFDENGEPSDTASTMKVGGNSLNTGWIAATIAPISDKAALVAALFTKLYDWLYPLTDDGGRINFPAVVKHNFNVWCASVRVT